MAEQSDDVRGRADQRLDSALREAPVQDPRPHYRQALRQLKLLNPAGFERALRFFEEQLVPAVASDADPLDAWLEYGRMIAAESGPGRIVEVGPSGRAHAADRERPGGGMLLWLPDDDGARAMVLRAPRPATRAQQATVELLVEGRVTASAYGRG